MTPEERERLTKELMIISPSLPPAPLKALPDGNSESAETTPTAPKPSYLPRTLPQRWRGVRLGVLVAIFCLGLLGTGLVEGLSPKVFNFGNQLLGLVPEPPTPTPTPTFSTIVRSPSISLGEVGRVLQNVNSPMLPYASNIYDDGVKYGIDPVFALAFWMKESREASDGSVAATDHNPGYTEGLGTDTRCGRWACWPTWPAGIEGWFHYMRVYFVDDRGMTTVEVILPIYAPPTENNTSNYIASVLNWVAQWRADSASL